MSTAAWVATPAATRAARPQIAVLRSCRATEFIAAVARLRGDYPDASLVAISHRGHDDTLRAAGVDDVVELPGRRFGPFRVAPWRLWRLRRHGFARVVVPQMTADPYAHRNLYWLAACVGAPAVTMFAPRGPSRSMATADVWRWLPSLSIRGLLDRVDVPLLMALLVVARWWPRVAAAKRSRRVLHVIPSLGLGGAQRQLASLLDHAPADHHIDVLVFTQDPGDFGRRWVRRPGVRITALTSWPRLAPMALEVARVCRDGRYDVVHTWLSLGNAVGAAGARLAGVPRVVIGERSLSLWKRTWYRQWWYRPIDALTARVADAVTVNARALAQDHAAWAWIPARRIAVVHNGLDPSQQHHDRAEARQWLRSTLGWPAHVTLIGTVGRLAPEKDQALLLRALASLRTEHQDLRCVVVGEGQCADELRAAAERLGVADIVAFLGARDDATHVVAGLDLFVLPSIIEGFPNALLEAVLLEVPACATRVGGCPDVLDDDPAVLFEVGDAEGLARSLEHQLAHASATARRARRLRARARGLFSAARVAENWYRVYDLAPTGGAEE
jgi:glycosyltransferase involved in cell wall biosynthesis